MIPNRAMPEHARVIRQLGGRMVRMYEAAITNNRNSDFQIVISNADAEIFTSTMPVRSRSRTLARDNPYASSILRTARANVGGHDPFRLEMKVGKWVGGKFVEETETNRLIEQEWEIAGLPENCTTRRDISRTELYLQAITSVYRDGGVMGRHRRGYAKNKYGYALQPLEVDRLDHYFNGKNEANGNKITLSVEKDEYDGVEAYWLLTKHPGAIFDSWNVGKTTKTRERVDAKDMLVIWDLRDRAEQTVGISRLHSVSKRLHQIDQFDEAHVMAAILGTCKAFFICQEFPQATEYVPDFIKSAMQGASADYADIGAGQGDKMDNLEPGQATVLPWGQKPMLLDPAFPVQSATGFKKDSLRAAVSGAGAPYHEVGQDLESVNFSSGRLGLEACRDNWKIDQELFIDYYARPHFNEWLRAAISNGSLPLPPSRLEEFQRAANFNGRRWDYIQPVQDAEADIMLIEAGITSRDAVIRERGGKGVEDVDSQIASDRTCDEKHGLDFQPPTKPSMATGDPSQAATGQPEKPGGDDPAPKNGKAHPNGFHRRGGLLRG
jgi:lambda family phage portal protein